MKWFLLSLTLLSAPSFAGEAVCGDPFRTENIGKIDKIQICVGIDECYYKDFSMKVAAFEPELAPISIERPNVSVESLFAD